MPLFNEKIELVDKNEIVRIRLGVDDNDNTYLSLNGKDGFERLVFFVDKEGNGSIGIRTVSGQPTVSLGMSPTLGTGIMILDVESEKCLTISIKNGSGGILLDTKHGTYSWPKPDALPQPSEECDKSQNVIPTKNEPEK
jgi:hypothetical protein